MKNKILQMLQLQQRLNDNTNGKNWENGITKNGKKIDWHRCIYMETLELIDSFSWKHWKDINKKPNWLNIKIELIDIWHFILSQILKEIFQKSITLNQIMPYMEKMTIIANKNSNIDKIFSHCEELIQLCIKRDSIDKIVEKFVILCNLVGLDIDELYKIYVGKNVLNIFRQDNGYKDGGYIKMWGDKEDNVFMDECLKIDGISYHELYDMLDKEYQKVKNSR